MAFIWRRMLSHNISFEFLIFLLGAILICFTTDTMALSERTNERVFRKASELLKDINCGAISDRTSSCCQGYMCPHSEGVCCGDAMGCCPKGSTCVVERGVVSCAAPVLQQPVISNPCLNGLSCNQQQPPQQMLSRQNERGRNPNSDMVVEGQEFVVKMKDEVKRSSNKSIGTVSKKDELLVKLNSKPAEVKKTNFKVEISFQMENIEFEFLELHSDAVKLALQMDISNEDPEDELDEESVEIQVLDPLRLKTPLIDKALKANIETTDISGASVKAVQYARSDSDAHSLAQYLYRRFNRKLMKLKLLNSQFKKQDIRANPLVPITINFESNWEVKVRGKAVSPAEALKVASVAFSRIKNLRDQLNAMVRRMWKSKKNLQTRIDIDKKPLKFQLDNEKERAKALKEMGEKRKIAKQNEEKEKQKELEKELIEGSKLHKKL